MYDVTVDARYAGVPSATVGSSFKPRADGVGLMPWFQDDPATRLAECRKIDDGVVIDPRISFGKHVAKAFGVTTHVPANQYRANGGNAAVVADLYGVAPADVAEEKVSVPSPLISLSLTCPTPAKCDLS